MRVVIVGGGYAGVTLARRLERSLPEAAELTLVDETGAHVIQHQLHRLVRYPGLREHVRIPLEDLLDRADIVEATVSQVDVDAPAVALVDGETLEADYLAVCLGAVTADHGLPGVAAHGQPLKSVADAAAIRERFSELGTADTVLVGGAGLSGIQIGGELAALRGDRALGPDIQLLERESRVAPSFPPAFRQTVRAALSEAGVDIRTEATVVGATESAVEFADGTAQVYDQLIWTGGIAGSPAMDGSRPEVRADLRLGDRVFAVGDAARVTDDRGDAVPASAQTAVRQSRTAAVNVTRLVEAELDGDLVFEPRLERYRHVSPGWVVSIGDDAVALLGDRVVRGSPARAVKTTVWLSYLSSMGRLRESLEVIADTVGVPNHEPG